MIEKEAIEVLKDFDKQVKAKADGVYQTHIGVEACDIAIKAIEEIQQYREIGTVEEIKGLLVVISESEEDVDESGISVGLIKNLVQLAKYRKIGTVEDFREAVEKQKPKKPLGGRDIYGYEYKICPECSAIVENGEWQA